MRFCHVAIAMTALMAANACAPAAVVAAPQETPIVFQATPEALFGATVSELEIIARERPHRIDRLRVIEEDPALGLIRAEHTVRDSVRVFAERVVKKPRLTVTVRVDIPARPEIRRDTLTIVVRPEAPDRAALVFTSKDRDGEPWRGGEELMARVVERLERRFERVEGH